MKKPYILLLAGCLLTLYLSCAGNADRQIAYDGNAAPSTDAGAMPASDESVAQEAELANAAEPITTNNLANGTVISPKIIKNAEVNYQVNNYKAARQQIIETVKTFNGRIASENENNNNHTLSNTFVIRIASDRFDTLLTQLLKPAIYIQHKTITSNDITEQYVDIQARLKARKAVEERYTQLLKQAKTIKEIMDVEAQLRLIREDIDAAEGKLRYMDSRVSESTIDLSIYEQLPYTSQPEQGFWSRIMQAFVNGWRSLIEFIISLVSIWSFLLLFGIAALLLRKVWGRKKTKTPN
jgi:hypothetical protein